MIPVTAKIKSVMIGHAVGDALGVPVEFSSREELSRSPVTDMKGYGTYPVPAGAWSDDTSMSVATLDCLADGEINWDNIMSAFADWCYHGKYTPTGELFDIGNICSYAIANYAKQRKPAIACGLCGEYSNGNGSLMRIHPFSLLTWYRYELHSDWESIIDQASALTHAHERSKLACKIYTMILHSLLDSPCKESVKSALQKAKYRYITNHESSHFCRLWDKKLGKLTADHINSGGYVVDSLEAAVWCVLNTDSYKECVLKAVNLGDDTDTTAAIAGGLAGALYGYDAIPRKWREMLIQREYIETMCNRAGNIWK